MNFIKSKIKVNRNTKTSDRNGFLKLDLEFISSQDIQQLKQFTDIQALTMLQYQLQNCTISEYEFDDYFDKIAKQQSIKYKEKDLDELDLWQGQSRNNSFAQDKSYSEKGHNKSQINVFTQILILQQMNLQYLIENKQNLTLQDELMKQENQKYEQALKQKENQLRKSKGQIKQLKLEVSIQENLLQEIKKGLLEISSYKCKLCPNKYFSSEEYLKQHHKRRHIGVLYMNCGDLNYKAMVQLEEFRGLIVNRMEFQKQYFKQEQQRVDEEISTEIINQLEKRSIEFKQEYLDFHKNVLQTYDKRSAVTKYFDEQNKLLQEQRELLYEEFIKIQQGIKESEIHCIKLYEERERERIRREKEEKAEKERLEKLQKEEEKRRLEELERQKQEALDLKRKNKEQRDKKGGQGMTSYLNPNDFLDEEKRKELERIRKEKEEEEKRLKEEYDRIEEERLKQKQKRINEHKKNSKACFELFNKFVNKRRNGGRNYDDKEYQSLLSTQLFDKYNKIFEKRGVKAKMIEISVKTCQLSQLEAIYQQLFGQTPAPSQSSMSKLDSGSTMMLEYRKMQRQQQNKEEEQEVIQEQEENEENDDKQIFEQGEQQIQQKSKRKNPLFDTSRMFIPYFHQPQINPKLKDLKFKKEDNVSKQIQTLQHIKFKLNHFLSTERALAIAETTDIYFAIGVGGPQRSRIVTDRIDNQKKLNQSIQVVDQNPLKIEKIQ